MGEGLKEKKPTPHLPSLWGRPLGPSASTRNPTCWRLGWGVPFTRRKAYLHFSGRLWGVQHVCESWMGKLRPW